MRRLKSMMRRFCETERALLKAKEEQLTLLEESISYQEPEEDMLLYITQEKLTEATHKYSGAVKLLDEYLFRKYVVYLVDYIKFCNLFVSILCVGEREMRGHSRLAMSTKLLTMHP